MLYFEFRQGGVLFGFGLLMAYRKEFLEYFYDFVWRAGADNVSIIQGSQAAKIIVVVKYRWVGFGFGVRRCRASTIRTITQMFANRKLRRGIGCHHSVNGGGPRPRRLALDITSSFNRRLSLRGSAKCGGRSVRLSSRRLLRGVRRLRGRDGVGVSADLMGTLNGYSLSVRVRANANGACICVGAVFRLGGECN